MHWIDIVWPAMGALSLALGLIHFLVWCRHSGETASLAFSSAAVAVAVLALFELALMRAESASEFALVLRWAIPVAAVLLVSLMAFVWLYFRVGKLALAGWSAVLHFACLFPNFLTGDSLMFGRVVALNHVVGWDGSLVAVPVGSANPWLLLWHLGDLLMLGFLVSVIMALREPRHDAELRRRGFLLCGALIVFHVVGGSWALLVSNGWLRAPFMVNVPFVGVVIMMSYLLGSDVVRAGQMNRALAQSLAERERQARELAAHRNELAHMSRVSMLGELSGSLAHELNQPVTAALSNAQAAVRFLEQDPPNLPEVREGLLRAIENDKRAADVIWRLRAMLRKERLEFQRQEINDVVDDVLKILRVELQERGVAVHLDLVPGASTVSGDRVQLQQVLLNLIINACEAMAGGEGDKTLTVRTIREPGPYIRFSLLDQGVGVRPEDLERIFLPFVTTKSQGMGVGLAVCRTIIQEHQGELWATPNSPRGTAMHFRLPEVSTAGSSPEPLPTAPPTGAPI